MSPSDRTIQGLWIGPALSEMERLSLSSFLRNGHAYHLYTYDVVANVPAGVVLQDASRVLPASSIFRYRDHPSYAGFSNFFRYKLLLERGGWWADTDVVCTAPLDFEDEHVFASERSEGAVTTTTAILKAPAGSEVMAYAWRACQAKDPGEIAWGETGPALLGEAVRALDLERHRRPPRVFCPIEYADWRRVIDPRATWSFEPDTVAIHLWNEMWRRAGQDKDRRYHPDCLYEQLRERWSTTSSPSPPSTR